MTLCFTMCYEYTQLCVVECLLIMLESWIKPLGPKTLTDSNGNIISINLQNKGRNEKGSKIVDPIVNLTNAEVKGLTIFIFYIFIEKYCIQYILVRLPSSKSSYVLPSHSFSLSLETNRKNKNKQANHNFKKEGENHNTYIHNP